MMAESTHFTTAYKIRDVCLLEERDIRTGRKSLYGVWATEAEGRADYGEEDDDNYELICTTVPMWGMNRS